MPERIIQRARSFPPNLYFIAPFETKRRFGIVRGSKLNCFFQRVLDSDGNVLQRIDREVLCEVRDRDGRFYVPPKLIQELNLTGREYYEIILRKLIKPNNEEVEIYPGEMIEKEVRVTPKEK
ncbi:MAG: hypothetical protein DRO36_00340 [Candidatus Hecatellales archaeon]|nr:MAG: hypothetical protein DRO36_00340 [Candidatus Hecatellales archaeon]